MNGGLWHCTRGSNQDHPQEKETQKGKMVVWGGLTDSCIFMYLYICICVFVRTNSCERREVKNKGEKERYTLWMQSSRE